MGNWNTLIELLFLGKCHGMLYKDGYFKIKCNISVLVAIFSKICVIWEIWPMWFSYTFYSLSIHCSVPLLVCWFLTQLFPKFTLKFAATLQPHVSYCWQPRTIQIRWSKAITDHQSRIWPLQPESSCWHITVGQHYHSSSV